MEKYKKFCLAGIALVLATLLCTGLTGCPNPNAAETDSVETEFSYVCTGGEYSSYSYTLYKDGTFKGTASASGPSQNRLAPVRSAASGQISFSGTYRTSGGTYILTVTEINGTSLDALQSSEVCIPVELTCSLDGTPVSALQADGSAWNHAFRITASGSLDVLTGKTFSGKTTAGGSNYYLIVSMDRGSFSYNFSGQDSGTGTYVLRGASNGATMTPSAPSDAGVTVELKRYAADGSTMVVLVTISGYPSLTFNMTTESLYAKSDIAGHRFSGQYGSSSEVHNLSIQFNTDETFAYSIDSEETKSGTYTLELSSCTGTLTPGSGDTNTLELVEYGLMGSSPVFALIVKLNGTQLVLWRNDSAT